MSDGSTRAKNQAAVDAAITAWTSKRSKQEVMATIAGAGVPCGAVLNTLELLHDPDLHARGMMRDDRASGARTRHGRRLALAHVRYQGCAQGGADPWRRQRDAIYGEWLDCSPAEVADLRQRKVI